MIRETVYRGCEHTDIVVLEPMHHQPLAGDFHQRRETHDEEQYPRRHIDQCATDFRHDHHFT